jgi:hypothetical protein
MREYSYQLGGCVWVKVLDLVKESCVAVLLDAMVKRTGTLRIIKNDEWIED